VIAGRIAAAVAAAAIAHQAPPFRTEARLVVVRATVRNARGEAVTGLDRAAFRVYENGRQQPISLFRADDVPVSIGLLVDNSGSMRDKRARVEAAAVAFAHASNPQDEMFVLNFADKPRIDVPMTTDSKRLEAGIARVDSIGGTALRDAVALAETYLADHASRDRRAIVVVTDGNDNASVVAPEQVRVEAQQKEIAIYAVGLLNDADAAKAHRARHDLDALADATGGLAYFPESLEAIDAVALDLAHQIRSQYTIGYTPRDQALDGTFRKIEVKVTSGDRLTVHTRAGYRATPRSGRD